MKKKKMIWRGERGPRTIEKSPVMESMRRLPTLQGPFRKLYKRLTLVVNWPFLRGTVAQSYEDCLAESWTRALRSSRLWHDSLIECCGSRCGHCRCEFLEREIRSLCTKVDPARNQLLSDCGIWQPMLNECHCTDRMMFSSFLSCSDMLCVP